MYISLTLGSRVRAAAVTPCRRGPQATKGSRVRAVEVTQATKRRAPAGEAQCNKTAVFSGT